MPFTNESDVRLRLQVPEAAQAPADLILASIEDAHAFLLPFLAPDVDVEDPPRLLARGEALLAGAMVLRALASRDAVAQKQMTIGGQRIEAGARFAALQTASKAVEAEAWETLAAFLISRECPQILLSDSQPILRV